MTTFPNFPRLMKGAIVGVDPMNPLASVVVFRYNPDTMTRRRDGMVPRRRATQAPEDYNNSFNCSTDNRACLRI